MLCICSAIAMSSNYFSNIVIVDLMIPFLILVCSTFILLLSFCQQLVEGQNPVVHLSGHCNVIQLFQQYCNT